MRKFIFLANTLQQELAFFSFAVLQPVLVATNIGVLLEPQTPQAQIFFPIINLYLSAILLTSRHCLAWDSSCGAYIVKILF